MAYTAQSTLREIIADPDASAILDKHLPGASTHPMLEQGLDMSLEAISQVPEAGLTARRLAGMVKGFAKLQAERKKAAAAAAKAAAEAADAGE